MFATNQALEHLSRSTTWFMDGTFATAKIFQQLCIIRVLLGLSAVPCVYAFLSTKSQSAMKDFSGQSWMNVIIWDSILNVQ